MRQKFWSGIFLFFTAIVLYSSLYAQVSMPEPYAASIRKEDLLKHLLVLTSDSLQGRETGEPGQKKAARYLESQFAALGLAPMVMENGKPTYLQRFPLRKSKWKQVYIEIGNKRYTHLKDMLYLGNSPQADVKSFEVLLAGEKTPSNMQGKLMAYMATSVSAWREKAAMARKAGALGAVVFVDAKDFAAQIVAYKPYLGTRYSLVDGIAQEEQEFAVVLPVSAFKRCFGSNSGQKGKKTSKTSGGKNVAIINCQATAEREDIYTENVLGYLEGGDKKDELLIVTAHYDHLGIRGKQIYRGADDNGTGTAALLEVAEAFMIAKEQGDGPVRSVLFMAMSGEEKGLLGSDYYTRFPVFPLAQTVANLNVDMIGRVDAAHKDDTNYVYLIGADRLSTQLHELSEEMNRRYTQLTLDYTFNDENDPNRFYYRSDHYNFAKHSIPVIFYFSGVHEDYHKPTDTIDKILFDKCTQIAQLIFHTAWEVANRTHRPQLDKKE